ncbi:3'-5' exonuclease [Leucobacter sp. cx-328]|uniref:exonuclease domain-containing protein n=1 Tax=unclassified Leucobacter TaxID=2621730 RepID=UPI00165D9EFD|nr:MULTISPECIES: exonuclease domain-containing protein [unclassified Leucobacter]MBC9943934.1 3'-5' exonuclease [Leucobacter sp. cx-328]
MQRPLPLWASQIAVFDTETTGIDTDTSRIVSATVALLGDQGEVLERYDWLLDPGVEIPDAAARVHGITTAIARTSGTNAAVGVAQIAARLAEMVDRGFPVVIYNAPYDLSLLASELERHNIDAGVPTMPILDPLIIDKQVDKYRRGKRTLEAASAHYGVELGTAHDAGDDAIAAGRVMQQIAAKFGESMADDLESIHAAQIKWAADQAENFQDYMRKNRDPNFTADGRWPIRRG